MVEASQPNYTLKTEEKPKNGTTTAASCESPQKPPVENDFNLIASNCNTNVCFFCQKSFTNVYNCRRHIRTHSGEKPFQCNVCGKRFSRQSTLNTHEKVHTGDQIFKCEVCARVFDVYRHLTEHMAVHRIDKPFTCKICNKNYSRATVLSQHMKLHTDEAIYKCQVCGKEFQNAIMQKEHEMEHVVDDDDELMTLYKCYACSETFKTSRECTNHMQVHIQQPVIVENHNHHHYQQNNHQNNQNNVQMVISVARPAIASVIKPVITELQVNNKVAAMPPPPPALTRPVQPAPPTTPTVVVEPKILYECESDDDIEEIEEDEILFYTCDVCSKTYKLEADLRAHQRTHTSTYEKYKCDICEKRFSLLSNFNVHKRIHSREKPFRCDICGKCFRLQKSLTVHMLLHTENESFNCEICQRPFSRSTALKLHMRTHSSLEQQQAYGTMRMCNVNDDDDDDVEFMDTDFAYDTLIEERPTYCDICGQKFTRSNGNIRTHKCTKQFTIDDSMDEMVPEVHLPSVDIWHYNSQINGYRSIPAIKRLHV